MKTTSLILICAMIVLLAGCGSAAPACDIAATTLPVYQFTSMITEGTGLTVTAVNLMDESVEAIECMEENVFGVQYYPDAAQGPNETFDPFDDYVALMKKANVNGEN